jgi:hypothetical protein
VHKGCHTVTPYFSKNPVLNNLLFVTSLRQYLIKIKTLLTALRGGLFVKKNAQKPCWLLCDDDE